MSGGRAETDPVPLWAILGGPGHKNPSRAGGEHSDGKRAGEFDLKALPQTFRRP